jgi:hypothetical protein
MKLLVLAQIPPPLHGQSLMVQTLVEGLPTHGIPVHHVNLALSRDATDIGRWRPGKFFALLRACVRTVSARFRHGCNTLYYVPAPGKRGALWRDLVVMLLCRPFFNRLVLHWHAAGLDQWLATKATSLELGLARLLLGRAALSIVLSTSLQADALALNPRKIAVVPNGIADPDDEPPVRSAAGDTPFQVLFLGLCSEEKGLFAATSAVRRKGPQGRAPVHARRRRPAGGFRHRQPLRGTLPPVSGDPALRRTGSRGGEKQSAPPQPLPVPAHAIPRRRPATRAARGHGA